MFKVDTTQKYFVFCSLRQIMCNRLFKDKYKIKLKEMEDIRKKNTFCIRDKKGKRQLSHIYTVMFFFLS